MLNRTLVEMEVYASKEISSRAKQDPQIAGLSFGEPEFGPPPGVIEAHLAEMQSAGTFMDSLKRYEDSRGSLELRLAVSKWYKSRYQLDVCPHTEVMITHGGVEAIALSVLCTTEPVEAVMYSEPSYMLYERAIAVLGRRAVSLTRSLFAEDQYRRTLSENGDAMGSDVRAMIINSPENPSGYVLARNDWDEVCRVVERRKLWLIHDEVYDTMSLGDSHVPARCFSRIRDRSILINSFSKKFGIPGLRIGWMVANREVIELATKAHDYLYLGVNVQAERLATRLLSGDFSDWLNANAEKIRGRARRATTTLTEQHGFTWPRTPSGAMFLFPDVSRLYARIPGGFKKETDSVSKSVAQFLLEDKRVAVVPGYVYGRSCDNHVRLVLCTNDDTFDRALERLQTC